MANLEKQVKALLGGPVLPDLLTPQVKAWAQSGYPGVTGVTEELLHHWFGTEQEGAAFHPAQRLAIETAIFVHEVLARGLPAEGGFLHALHAHLGAPEDRDRLFAPWWEDPVPRYGFKLATGTGKTWILQALLVWQVLNHLALEGPAAGDLEPEERTWRQRAFSARCLVVTPGLVVHGRLLDAFLGPEDERGNRDLQGADLRKLRQLFLPNGRQDAFLGVFRALDGREVMETTPQPEAFALIVNWQALMDRSGEEEDAEHPAELLDLPRYSSVTERGNPRYLVLREWLAQAQDLIVFNDEAHHTHTNPEERGYEGGEGVWEQALLAIRAEQQARHGQVLGWRGDFSATPFFQVGSGRGRARQAVRKWFPHILCDYGLREAQRDMLVKQIWIVKDPRLPEGDIHRAEEGRLTESQKALIDVGLAKRNWVQAGFPVLGVTAMPKLMVVAENTSLADQAVEFLERERIGEHGLLPDCVAVLHSGRKGQLDKDEYKALRRRIFAADRRDDLQVIVNVAMLQEGFDVNSICVIVFLRAGESAILVEQVIGRGLRLMFRQESWPEIWPQKVEDARNLWDHREPMTALDMLFLVDHPRFRQKLKEFEEAEGLNFGEGEVDEGRPASGEFLTVGIDPERVPGMDFAWPLGFIRADPPIPNVRELLKDGQFLKYGDQRILGHLRQEKGVQLIKEHLITETQVPWTAELSADANQALVNLANALVDGRKGQSWLSDQWADMVDVVEAVARKHLFPGTDFDPLGRPEDARVLRQPLVHQHLLKQLQDARDRWLQRLYAAQPSEIDVSGWGWASNPELDGRDPVMRGRESRMMSNRRCVFPRTFEASQGGGLERDFIEQVLEKSGEVLGWFKPLERRHSLNLNYRTRFGELSRYWPDFLVRTASDMWLLETKAARDRELPVIWDKAKAALTWCRTASLIPPPCSHPCGSAWSQPQAWHYAILFDDQWDRNPTAFTPLALRAEAFTLAYLRGQGEIHQGSLLDQMR